MNHAPQFYAQLKPEWYQTFGGDNALQVGGHLIVVIQQPGWAALGL